MNNCINDNMATVNRKVTFKLYPNAAQLTALQQTLHLHCRLYNTLIEENQRHDQQGLGRFNFKEMCKAITGWRTDVSALEALNAQSLQVTAKRVSLAFNAFFRRVKAGDTPGYPRFKASSRFRGWGYKTHGDGWKLTPSLDHRGRIKHAHLRLTGFGQFKIRGRGRFDGVPKTAEIVQKRGAWYLSVTFVVEDAALRRAPAPRRQAAFDLGVETLATLAANDGSIETVENPRWLKNNLDKLRQLQQKAAAEQERLSARAGLPSPLPMGVSPPVNGTLRRLRRQIGALQAKIARQRHDALHKLSADLVGRFDGLATEELDVKPMVRRPKSLPQVDGSFAPNGAAGKTALRRSLHDAAPATLLAMIAYKAEEAGTLFVQAPTKQLKPTQRCHACDALVPKDLATRVHVCACGVVCGRDENAARTLLRWFEATHLRPGTGPLKPPLAA
jgi:putative transposase